MQHTHFKTTLITSIAALHVLIFAVSTTMLIPSPTLARSGCCSHHGGVSSDGCGCNDGTSLSATCSPYYQCSSSGSSAGSYTAPVSTYKKEFKGATYYSENAYNDAVESDFQTAHQSSVKTAAKNLLGREVSDSEVKNFAATSRDLSIVENNIKNTDEYKEIQFQIAHKAGIKASAELLLKRTVTDQEVSTWAVSSRDLSAIEDSIKSGQEYTDMVYKDSIATVYKEITGNEINDQQKNELAAYSKNIEDIRSKLEKENNVNQPIVATDEKKQEPAQTTETKTESNDWSEKLGRKISTDIIIGIILFPILLLRSRKNFPKKEE